ncbi:MAG TPA: VIT1/CCC1 transporter family protein [Miltoncostaeaceae bacterium]|nr:VIT1/CCC1 transporter family protein [Miltoncostaeaceae bacterium]
MPLPSLTHPERHLSGRSNWLRAAVLGANDGLVSVSSLLLGVVAGGASHQATILAGFAGLAAGALSMAAGEFVSVSSQRDAENADLALEGRELRADPAGELEELAGIYERRGLPSELAHRVAEALTDKDALGAHARDELGLAEERMARPWQAAWASALAFTAGATVPVVAAVAPGGAGVRVGLLVGLTIAALAGLGAIGAALGGAPRWPAVARVTLWGAAAMGLTAAVGSLVGAAV